jgi:hypothetical protein
MLESRRQQSQKAEIIAFRIPLVQHANCFFVMSTFDK